MERLAYEQSHHRVLRTCNLADTPHWREWLRKNIENQTVGNVRVYESGLVQHIAAKIAPMAGTPEPEPTRTQEPEIRFSGAVDSGLPPRPKRAEQPLDNRNGPSLETR